MKIDKIFLKAIGKSVRINGGQERFAKISGISQPHISRIISGKLKKVSDSTKRKLLPLVKDHFPEDHPIEKWLAEQEGMYLSPDDIKANQFQKDPEQCLSEGEKHLLDWYRDSDKKGKEKILECARLEAISALEDKDPKKIVATDQV